MVPVRRTGAFREITLEGIACAKAIALIAGQRQRHSPSIGIRVTDIEILDGFREVKPRLLSCSNSLATSRAINTSVETRNNKILIYRRGRRFIMILAIFGLLCSKLIVVR